MSLQKIVKSLLQIVAAPAVMLASSTGLNFYRHHNINYEMVDGTRVMKVRESASPRAKARGL